MEAVCYVLIYFLKGSLPWQGLKAENLRERYHKICETKRATSIDTLCESLPEEFSAALRYCRQLNFEEEPDYDYLESIYSKFLDKTYHGSMPPMDWVAKMEVLVL